MRYLPNTDQDRRSMLAAIGAGSVAELFADIPEETRLKRPLELPPPMAEPELRSYLKSLAGQNWTVEDYACFLGAGAYDHYIPSVVGQILSRNEFYTAYTPYQPEVSQGTLQSIYEYQTMIAELTGMDVANASMYDGASAAAEAMLMACRIKRKMKFAVSEAIHPEYLEVIRTVAEPMGIEIVTFPYNRETGMTEPEEMKAVVTEACAGFLVGYPNFFGIIEDIQALRAAVPDALMAVNANPIALGVLKAPGDLGADIVCGEGQPLGGSLYLGGMSLGLLTTKKEYIRNIPGRIIGETKDIDGHRGFVMVLQTREQHIRRAKATSNICSNHAHNALVATLYMALLGKQGLKAVALQSAQKAHALHARIERMERYRPRFSGPFFNEFVVESNVEPEVLQKELMEQYILGPLPLKHFYRESFYDHLCMFAVTEANRIEDIHFLTARMEEIV